MIAMPAVRNETPLDGGLEKWMLKVGRGMWVARGSAGCSRVLRKWVVDILKQEAIGL